MPRREREAVPKGCQRRAGLRKAENTSSAPHLIRKGKLRGYANKQRRSAKREGGNYTCWGGEGREKRKIL